MLVFNGIDIEKYAKVISCECPVLPERENKTKEIPNFNGLRYIKGKYKTRNIKVVLLIKSRNNIDFRKKLDIIAEILDVEEAKTLKIDNTGRFYYAVPEGNFDKEKIYRYKEKFNINFICYNPFAYSEDIIFKSCEGLNTIEIENKGNRETNPIIQVVFQNPAHFIQINHGIGSLLVGKYPVLGLEDINEKEVNIKDDCTSTTNWASFGSVADKGVNGGTLSIDTAGYGIIAGDYGSGDTWHGASYKRQLENELSSFKVVAEFNFDSIGRNGTTAINTPEGTYECNAKVSLNIRSGRGVSYSILGSLPTGEEVTIQSISNGWGRITYNDITGYVSMKYMKLKYTTSFNYVTKDSANIRKSPNLNSAIITTLPQNTSLYVYDIQNKWGKVIVNGQEGYIKTSNLKKINGDNTISNEDIDSADKKIGMIELYGFDTNGQKLFKFKLADDNKYYEFTYPQIFIGNKLVLEDTNLNYDIQPNYSANVSEETEGEKKKTTLVNVESSKDTSGRYGNWNNFDGYFSLTREVDENNNHTYSCEIVKNVNGCLYKKIEKANIYSSEYPMENLAYVVLYIAGYGSDETPNMALTKLEISGLKTIVEEEKNEIIFNEGDSLTIDTISGDILLNDSIDYISKLDIGSKYPIISKGLGAISFYSDDPAIINNVIYREKWL